MTGRVRVGTSGWSYPHWRGDFFPEGLVHRRELEFLAERLDTAEANGSFYSLQRPDTYRRWVEQTPDPFVFAVKGSRFVTHMRRLIDVETPLANLFASGVLALGPKLGPVLWQLPATLEFDERVLEAFLALLPRTVGAMADLAARHDDRVPADRALTTTDVDLGRRVRHALEFRHPSFAAPSAIDLLREHGVACVWADAAATWPEADEDTTDFRYVRLHGHTQLYASGYAPASLDTWARRCRAWAAAGRDVYVYFDNDARGRAPHDAVALRARLGTSST